MKARIACIVAAALILAACGTPTPYVPAGESGYGYAAQRIEDNRYRVSFTGNSLTPRSTVENYLLYHAAELTLAQGKDYFVVLRRETDADTTYYTTYDRVPYFPYAHRHWHPYWGPGFGYAPWDTGTTRSDTRYRAHAEILLRSGRKPADNPQAFDAREVVRNLGPSVVRLAQRPGS